MNSSSALTDEARSIFHAALSASTVEAAFSRKLSAPEIDGIRHLAFTDDSGRQQQVPLTHLRDLRIIAIGKAAAEMLRALLTRFALPSACTVTGVLIARERPLELPLEFQFFPGGHPLPNQASFDGARAALDLLHRSPPSAAPAETLCLFLISGGASAMMELPLDPRIALPDTVALYRALVHSGASITEINCVRKHISAVKGGRLAQAAAPHPCLSLLVSDVPPASLDALASGPTLPDTSTVADCREILARHHLLPHLPASVQAFLSTRDLPETPKPADLHAPHWTLLDSNDLATTAAAEARRLGFHTVVDNTPDDWDYREAAAHLLDELRRLRTQHRRVCLISSGEVTVEVIATTAPHGKGGRNQHLALYLATLLTPVDAPVAILSAGSDGIDGNSEATGAVIDEQTLRPDHAPALDALARFDSATFLAERSAAIITGPTGNNLRDLRILLAG